MWTADVRLAERHAELWLMAERKDATVADLYNRDQAEVSWNMGFMSGFYKCEMNGVNELYTKLENQKLYANVGDRLMRKMETVGRFIYGKAMSHLKQNF